ncbi:zinc finger, CCHC-type containing protein [Tanacetum coccineum]
MVQAQMDDDVAWWVDSGATVHVCNIRCWLKTYESLNGGYILHMGKESTALVHGRAFMSTSNLNDSILWHAKLGHVHYKRMQDMSKDGLILAFDMDTKKCKTCMLIKITKKPFQNFKLETEVLELIRSDLYDSHATPSLGNKKYFVTFIDDAFRTKREGEYMDTLYFQSIGIIHKMTDLYTPQQNVVSKEITKVVIVQQLEHELRKGKKNKTSKNFGPEFQLHLLEGTRDEFSDQHSNCLNVDDDSKTFYEAMKS